MGSESTKRKRKAKLESAAKNDRGKEDPASDVRDRAQPRSGSSRTASGNPLEWEPLDGDDTPPDAGGFFPDLIRKGLTLGFTGFFMTEEAIRKALGDTVPKDVIQYVLEQSERMRLEFVDRVSQELGRTVASLDPVDVAKRLLDGRTVEVTARFRILPEEPARSRPEGDDDRGDA